MSRVLKPDHPFYGDPHDTGTSALPCGDPCCIVCGHGDPLVDGNRGFAEEDEQS